MALTAGTRLGAYELVALIGAGGMGEVYRARDTRLKREVALKILPDAFASDPERLARFQREAELLATLNHSNIAQIYGIEDRALILELVDGPTLGDRIAQGRIPIDEALPIARQIAEALEAAHERGVIHRDLKPANVKLTSDGTVKVLDFGLAKAFDTPGSGPQPNLSQSPTITSPVLMTGGGMILGTAAYMSPEQARGKAVDKRSDIWAFGCVLYEMLTGKRPFDGEDVTDVLASVVRGEPDWTGLPDDMPEQIRLLIRRCLEKDRSKRISDIGVARFLMTEPNVVAPHLALAAPQRPGWRRAVPVLAFGVVVGAGVGTAVLWLRPSSPPHPQAVTRSTYRLGDGQRFTNIGRHLVAISPDGTQMAYVANFRVYLKSMSEFQAKPIPETEAAQVTTPIFSPDGRWIAFFSRAGTSGGGGTGTLKKIATSGGVPVTLCEALNPFGMSWEGGSILFGQPGKGILRISENGGTPEVVAAAVKANEYASSPQMLPGGRSLLFTLANGSDWDTAQIVVQTVGSPERKTVIKGGSDGRYLPSGHLVYALGGGLFAIPFDAQRLEAVGGPVPIVEGVLRATATPAAHFSVSTTGSLIYVPGPTTGSAGQFDLALLDRKGTIERLKLPSRAYESPRFSPDARWLAVGSDDGKEAIIWIYDLSRTTSIRRLTFGGHNRYPIWSPDSTRVVFQSDRDGDTAIFWQRADGSGTAERLTRPDKGEAHMPQSWPVGDTFLFSVADESNQSLWTYSIGDKKAAPFAAVVNPRATATPNGTFSPDSRWVAYTSTETGTPMVFVQPFPATGAKYQVGSGVNPFWAPDGAELFFGGAGTGQFATVSVKTQPTFTFGNPTILPRPVSVPTISRNYDIAPDGHRFVITVDANTVAADEDDSPTIQVVLNWFEELKHRVPVNSR